MRGREIVSTPKTLMRAQAELQPLIDELEPSVVEYEALALEWRTAEEAERTACVRAHIRHFMLPMLRFLNAGEPEVSDLPSNITREGGKSLVIGGSSLVILEGREGNPL